MSGNTNEKPFIHLYRSPRGYYFFDVNKDTIVSVNKDIYDHLDGKTGFDELSDDDKNRINDLKKDGYLSGKHYSEIKHPDLDELNYYLDNKCNQLILQVTQSCNLVCYYCAYANKSGGELQRDHSNKMMTWETAKAGIDFFYEHSKENTDVTISFYGGEPLIAFDLIKKAVLYAEELFQGKKLSFSMTSNATLYNDEIIEFVMKHNFNLLFSIDGPESIHDINRLRVDGTGSFKSAFENLCKITKLYGKEAQRHVSVNSVLNPANDVDEVLSLFDEEVFEKYKIGVSSTLADDDYLVNKIEVTEAYNIKIVYQYFLGLLDHLKLVDGLKISPVVTGYTSSLTKIYGGYKKVANGLADTGAPGGPCIPGQRRLFLNADGDFYPCERVSELTDVMKIGNIREGFYYDKAAAILNVGSITAEKCKNCYAITHCQLCAKCAAEGDHLSAAQRMEHCSETYSSFDNEVASCILIKESRTLYKRR